MSIDQLVPPQNLDAEEYVLGAMLISERAIEAAAEILAADGSDFYKPSHARIYVAAAAMYERAVPVDALTLAEELADQGLLEEIGGKVRVHELAALVPAVANTGHYARLVKDAATLRGLIRVGNDIARLGWERPGPAKQLVEDAERIVFGFAEGQTAGELSHIGPDVTEHFNTITRMFESGQDTLGLSSGFRAVDKITGGFQDGNLVVIAARPSMGKSALALGIAANAAIRYGTPAAVYSMEMSRAEIVQRLLAMETGIDSEKVRLGRLSPEDWTHIAQVSQRISDAPLYVDDNGALTMLELRSQARRAVARDGIRLLIVDYLQLMAHGPVEHRVAEVTAISRNLKVLARELNVPVIALSQLNRQVEQRHDKRPVLSDLRESGAIEQDADLVAFIYRDDHYNKNSESPGEAEVIVSKHRNGPTGTAQLTFLSRCARFSNMERP